MVGRPPPTQPSSTTALEMPAATKKGAPPSRKGPKTKEDKTLKRKREQEDFTKLDAAVNDLVSQIDGLDADAVFPQRTYIRRY